MRGKFGKLLQIKLYYLLGAVLLAPDFDEPEERCGGELAMGVVSLQQLLIARGRLRQALTKKNKKDPRILESHRSLHHSPIFLVSPLSIFS